MSRYGVGLGVWWPELVSAARNGKNHLAFADRVGIIEPQMNYSGSLLGYGYEVDYDS